MTKQLLIPTRSVLGIADNKPVMLSQATRWEGLYIIGTTGVGKATD